MVTCIYMNVGTPYQTTVVMTGPSLQKAKIQTQTNPYVTGGGKSGFGSGSAPQYFGFPLSA